MLSVPITSGREHSSKTVTAIISLNKDGKLLAQISDQLTLPQYTVATFLHRYTKQLNQPF